MIEASTFKDKCIEIYNKDENGVKLEGLCQLEDYTGISKEEEPPMLEEQPLMIEEHLEEYEEMDPLDNVVEEDFDNPRIRYRYTLKEKLQAIKVAEEIGNRAAEKILSIGESCIRKWRSQKVEILNEVNLERNRLPRKKSDQHLEVTVECKPEETVTIAYEDIEGRKKEFRPRKSYQSSLKLDAVAYAEVAGNRQAAKVYRIDESCIRKWRSQKDQLIKVKEDRNTKRIPNLRFPEIEKRLKHFVEQNKKEGILLKPNEIKAESIKIARELNVQNFKGTSSYIFKFMERYQIQSRKATKYENKMCQ